MGIETNINTKEYWDFRFENNWEQSNGKMQTKYFANLAMSMLPTWFLKEVQKNGYSFCDVGCACGDALPVFSKVFYNSELCGADFSDAAINLARSSHPFFSFEVVDICDTSCSMKYDIIYCSNTIEHFENPRKVLSRLIERSNYYTIVMVPFREKGQISEHVVDFDTYDFPVLVNGGQLVYACSVLGDEVFYPEEQLLLLYSKDSIVQKASNLGDLIEHVNNSAYNLQKESLNESIEGNNQLKLMLDITDSKNLDLESQVQQIRVANENKDKLLLDLESQIEQIQVANEKKGKLLLDLESQIQQIQIANENKDKLLSEKSDQLNYLQATLSSKEYELNALKLSASYRFGNFFGRLSRFPLIFPFTRLTRKTFRMTRNIFQGNWNSLVFEIKEPFARVGRSVNRRLTKKQDLDTLKKIVQGKTVIIFPPTIDWNMPLYQRPQQLATAYSKKHGVSVVYLTTNKTHDSIANIEQISENLWLMNAECFPGYTTEIERHADKTVLSLSWAVNKIYLKVIKTDFLIYEYIDELEIFDKYDEKMLEDHNDLLLYADVTVCTATRLYEQVKGIATNAILSTNAGDYDLFVNTPKFSISNLIKYPIKKYERVVGYYGALASWFDYELVKNVAMEKTSWAWVLIGLNYDGSLDTSGILNIPNIIYVPAQEYKSLPSFLNAFDIATIPFVINEITLSTSPVKLFEYMASGKPILASRMPECLKYKSVFCYEDSISFIALAEEIFSLKEDDPYWEVLKEEALANTWDAKTDEILSALFASENSQ